MQYSKQLDLIHYQIKKVNNDIPTFRIWQTFKKLSQIRSNFLLLDKQKNEFKQFNLNTQKYSNNSSAISTDLFKLTQLINDFAKNNSFDVIHLDVTQLKSINNNINAISIHINEEISYIDSNQLFKLFTKEFDLVDELYNSTFSLFEIDKSQFAYNALSNEVSAYLKNNDIPGELRITTSKSLKNSKDRIEKVNLLLTVGKFEEPNRIIKEELITLEKILNNLKSSDVLSLTFKNYFNDFKDHVSKFYELLNTINIKELYNFINVNFSTNEEVKNYIHANIILADEITHDGNELNKYVNRRNQVQNLKLVVNFMIKIYSKILEFKDNNDKLLATIHTQYKDYFYLIVKYNELDIKLLNIKKLIIDHKVRSVSLLSDVEAKMSYVSKIKKDLIAGNIANDKNLDSEINSLNNFIITSLEIIQNEINLVAIIKRLKLYSNRYYNQTSKEQLDLFESLYKSQKYEELIEEYTSFIQKMKKQKRVS
ncbi:MAG: hypothetical protein ACRC42_01830 [Mycoplasma sp.]